MKTSSPPPNEPAADRAMDALLHEHARLQTHDDEDFLAEFEQRLAREPENAAASPPTVVGTDRHTGRWIGGFVAAACLCLFGIWLQLDQPSQHLVQGHAIDLPLAPEAKKKELLATNETPILVQSPTRQLTLVERELVEQQAKSVLDSARRNVLNPQAPERGVLNLGGRRPQNQKSVQMGEIIASGPRPTPGLEDGYVANTAASGGVSLSIATRPAAPAPLVAAAGSVSTMTTETLSMGSPPPQGQLTTHRKKTMPGAIRYQLIGTPSAAVPTEGTSPALGDRYTTTPHNPFRAVTTEPLSTFSVDVDTASYANLRRILQSGGSVPPEAVRIEEMINYFPYHYEEPQGEHPFSVKVESASCPWEPSHRLVKIALKAKEMDRSKRSPANLVFLIDVSGSMQGSDRLGLVVENLRVLTQALQPDDTVAIVTYAGSEGLALPPTSGADKATILAKLDSLGAGGSTNGGAGIKLAYSTAQSRLLKEGINRVILCTDGDFNVGTTSETSLVDLVAAEAKKGVFLTVCGYGSGNLNDSMMEAITNKGNGVYHYIDSAREGRKVFQDELLSTLFTVAKDVKLQIEFNPQHAAQYRLIGYDNRMLAKEDFANDKVDAGDIGAGHRVTALYEVIPVGAPGSSSIPLKYQQPTAPEKPAEEKPLNPELLTVKLRYKEPTADVSKPFDIPFVENLKAQPSADLIFAATVAEFGERLRGHMAPGRTLDQLMEAAESARGDDPHGHRAEFIELMRKSAK